MLTYMDYVDEVCIILDQHGVLKGASEAKPVPDPYAYDEPDYYEPEPYDGGGWEDEPVEVREPHWVNPPERNVEEFWTVVTLSGVTVDTGMNRWIHRVGWSRGYSFEQASHRANRCNEQAIKYGIETRYIAQPERRGDRW